MSALVTCSASYITGVVATVGKSKLQDRIVVGQVLVKVSIEYYGTLCLNIRIWFPNNHLYPQPINWLSQIHLQQGSLAADVKDKLPLIFFPNESPHRELDVCFLCLHNNILLLWSNPLLSRCLPCGCQIRRVRSPPRPVTAGRLSSCAAENVGFGGLAKNNR